jgi:hypothetical protein
VCRAVAEVAALIIEHIFLYTDPAFSRSSNLDLPVRHWSSMLPAAKSIGKTSLAACHDVLPLQEVERPLIA